MVDAQVCTWCGAPVRELVRGTCPHCDTVLDEQQAAGLVVDARGDIWRVVLVDAGRKPKKVAKAIAAAAPHDEAGARALVDAVHPTAPQIVAERITGTAALAVVQALAAAGATVRSEYRQGGGWAPGMALGS